MNTKSFLPCLALCAATTIQADPTVVSTTEPMRLTEVQLDAVTAGTVSLSRSTTAIAVGRVGRTRNVTAVAIANTTGNGSAAAVAVGDAIRKSAVALATVSPTIRSSTSGTHGTFTGEPIADSTLFDTKFGSGVAAINPMADSTTQFFSFQSGELILYNTLLIR